MKKIEGLKVAKPLFLTVFFMFMVFPIVWMFLTSLKLPKDIYKIPVEYIPSTVTFQNYLNVWTRSSFPRYFLNSLMVAGSASFLTLIISTFAGYSFARYSFKGRRLFFFILLISQMFPVVLLIVPIYLIFSNLHLIDTLYSLIFIYTALSTPFCSFLMVGFFQGVPRSLEESALMDGCTLLQAIFSYFQ